MTRTPQFDEERLADLLRALQPAPQAWVQAAQELPLARAELDQIVARATADAEFRARLVADLESALAQEGYEPDERFLEELRNKLVSE
jgi:type VI protein secretion system component VasF